MHWHLALLLFCGRPHAVEASINRKSIVQLYNPTRLESNPETPLQVGNGDFAFGVDITGLQTFTPFATLSTWGWHNFSLPTTPGQTEISDYHGTDWWTHGRLVNYNMASANESVIGNWLRENPHRINLGQIGLSFKDKNVTEAMLTEKTQTLDMWTGTISSQFRFGGELVKVTTVADPESDTVAISIESSLLSAERLGIFFDFPYPTSSKFEAPSVGVFNATDKHSTTLAQRSTGKARITHKLDDTTYDLQLAWNSEDRVSRPSNSSHRYYLGSSDSDRLDLTAHFSETRASGVQRSVSDVIQQSFDSWEKYWTTGAFIDLTGTDVDEARELQRITVQSQYLQAVNSASKLPPQESGLVNNGWYGKFHMEMVGWHLFQFARWNQWDIFWRSMNRTYNLLLEGAFARAKRQGYDGARWGKMTGNDLNDGPGEINSLLIWQQPHVMYFAELEYRQFPTDETLAKWDNLITASADFMFSYGFWNETSHGGCYQLGPPMYPVSENTNPNATMNPTFELAYWRFGFEVASRWKERQDEAIPEHYTEMLEQLCPLPVDDGTYPIYEGIPNMWTDNETVTDHPAMSGIYGLLPPPVSKPESLNLTVVQQTAERIYETWDLPNSYGWDFPMLAMNSLRLGDTARAIEYLLHPSFDFDDAGYPTGSTRTPRPYFPSAGSFLLAMAMMAGGWDGEEYPHFPEDWTVEVEGFTPAM